MVTQEISIETLQKIIEHAFVCGQYEKDTDPQLFAAHWAASHFNIDLVFYPSDFERKKK